MLWIGKRSCTPTNHWFCTYVASIATRKSSQTPYCTNYIRSECKHLLCDRYNNRHRWNVGELCISYTFNRIAGTKLKCQKPNGKYIVIMLNTYLTKKAHRVPSVASYVSLSVFMLSGAAKFHRKFLMIASHQHNSNRIMAEWTARIHDKLGNYLI